MKSAEKDNLSTKAYEEIKKMILSGELKQGQAVSINAMAEQLEISRTPVTNACQKLEYEKLLTIVPKQGVIINTISIEDACGIYELRAAIESYNAKRVMDMMTDDDINVLKDSIKKQTTEVEAGDAHAFMDEDHFFHRYILSKNMNHELLSVINQLYDRAYMLGIKNSLSVRLNESIEEHKHIVAALEKRDRQAFADAIEENILNGFRSLTRRYLV
ncbi:GntR family transcriptional regulator [Anaerotignum sp.]